MPIVSEKKDTADGERSRSQPTRSSFDFFDTSSPSLFVFSRRFPDFFLISVSATYRKHGA